MMTIRKPPSEDWPRRWRTLRAWDRAALVVLVLGTLLLSAALIYYRPDGTSSGAPPAGAATAGPPFPPGTRWYYQRGQWVPQDQQAPVQP
jgi:hypothetical protein